MNNEVRRLRALMSEAVEACVRHVEAGGLPFVGVIVTADGQPLSDPGVNRVRETGDPNAHAEILAMRQVLHDHDTNGLQGTTLLATGEPCALCYRFAATQQVDSVWFAVDRDTAAAYGFDYRDGYQALGTDQLRLARTARQLPVDRGLEPFTRYAQRHRAHHPTSPNPRSATGT